MQLNPYGEYAVLLAASLANDLPSDTDAILRRTRKFGMTMRFELTGDDETEVRGVIDEWLAVVDAPSPSVRAELLNAQMAAVSAYPRLTDHDGEGWHLHYRDGSQTMARVLSAVFSVGTALHLTTRGMSRLGRCASTPCERVIVDVTRNGTQRYCSVRCANRAAVRRHRSRT